MAIGELRFTGENCKKVECTQKPLEDCPTTTVDTYQCPPFDAASCLTENGVITYDNHYEGCVCPKCENRYNCGAKYIEELLTYQKTNGETCQIMTNLTICTGSCSSASSIQNTMLSTNLTHFRDWLVPQCQCCNVHELEEVTLDFTCTSGTHLLLPFPRVISCECSDCTMAHEGTSTFPTW